MISIRIEHQSDIAIIHLVGSFYVDSVRDVDIVWKQEFEKKPRIIAFDFRGLNYIDSSAIGALVKYFNTAKKTNVELCFLDLNPSIEMVFNTAKINKFFHCTTRTQFELDNPGSFAPDGQ